MTRKNYIEDREFDENIPANALQTKVLVGGYGISRDEAKRILSLTKNDMGKAGEIAHLMGNYALNLEEAQDGIARLGFATACKTTKYFLSGQKDFRTYPDLVTAVRESLEARRRDENDPLMLLQSEIAERSLIANPKGWKREYLEDEDYFLRVEDGKHHAEHFQSRTDRIAERLDPF
jgi:hypothetical protein